MGKNQLKKSTEIVGNDEAIELSQKSGKSVVVLVPGWKDTCKTLAPLMNYLRTEGFPVVGISPQPSDGSQTIPEMAEALVQPCLEIIRATHRPLRMVGFSMGGLIVRSYLQEFDGAKNCSHLVTISTPHMGVLTALVTKKPGLRQMLPNDPWLQQLNATFGEIPGPKSSADEVDGRSSRDASTVDETTHALTDNEKTDLAERNQQPLKVTSIWSPFDTTIIPPSSSFLAMVNNVTILSPVHALIMRDVRVHRAVGEALDNIQQ